MYGVAHQWSRKIRWELGPLRQSSLPQGSGGWAYFDLSADHGKTFHIKKIIKGYFGYSVTQISPDGKNLLCLYETKKVKELRFLSIPLTELK